MLIPTPYVVAHVSRPATGPKDTHGNATISASDVVLRKVQSISQFGRRGSSRAIFTSDTARREEITMQLGVPDPEVYHNGDQVLLDPELDANGEYVPGTGVAYWIDGEPSDERTSPWPSLFQQFGGVVKLRRVT